MYATLYCLIKCSLSNLDLFGSYTVCSQKAFQMLLICLIIVNVTTRRLKSSIYNSLIDGLIV
jgi:hypothetical protein